MARWFNSLCGVRAASARLLSCAECVLRGLPCNVELAKRGRNLRPTCAYFAAQALWWATFASLPARLRNMCYDRLRDTSSIEIGARAKLGRRGVGTGQVAGCNLTEPRRRSDADEFDWSPWRPPDHWDASSKARASQPWEPPDRGYAAI